MKTIRTSLMLFSLVLGLGVVYASATTNEIAEWLKVTFNQKVQVDDLTLPAGTYVFEQMPGMQQSQDRGTFKIWHNGDILGITSPAKVALDKTSDHTAAFVAEVNGKAYLKRINVAGTTWGWNFMTARQDQNFQQAQNQNPQEMPLAVEVIHPENGQTAQEQSRMSASSTSSSSGQNSSMYGNTNQNSSANNSNSGWRQNNSAEESAETQNQSSNELNSNPNTYASGSTQNNQGTSQQNWQSSNNTASNSGVGSAAGNGSVIGSNSSSNLPNGQNSQNSAIASNNRGMQSGRQVQVIGCVHSQNGASYLLTKEGSKYELRGDQDNIREYSGRTVSVTGVVNPNTQNFQPVFVTVQKLAPMAEMCDTQ